MAGLAALGRGAVVALAIAVAGCASGDASFGERQELANMPARLMVPASRPATLIGTFRRHCVETPSDNAARAALLRASDYVPMGGWSGGARRFVVADTRPMVILSDTGRTCAVQAAARSGQTNAIAAEIARTWPEARPLAPSAAYEAAWETAPGQAEVVALLRNPRGPGQNEITLALMRR